MSTNNLVSPHEIRKGLKTWEMLKLVEENPGHEVHAKPENQHYQDNDPWLVVKNNDLIGWKNTWTVKIAPKEVTITRQKVVVAWHKVQSMPNQTFECGINNFCKELGL